MIQRDRMDYPELLHVPGADASSVVLAGIAIADHSFRATQVIDQVAH
jgi:hypothetical protein